MDDILSRKLLQIVDPGQRAPLTDWLLSRPRADATDTLVLDLVKSELLRPEQKVRVLLMQGRPQLSNPDDPASRQAPADTPLEGQFAVLAEIGRGAMGTVHVARDLELRRKVAYKKLSLATDVTSRRQFVSEAQITAQLDHPNIVPIYHLRCPADGSFAYAMKLIDGRTLSELCSDAARRHREGLVVQEASERSERLELFLRVCDGVAYAHSLGVIHRDLKPENIMIGSFGEVHIMDWGIACLADEAAVDELIRGTPSYMAPEQVDGTAASPAMDQYALGLILQELVTLKRARESTPNMVAALIQAARGIRVPMEHVRPVQSIPEDLVAIVARATCGDPTKRYPDVASLSQDVHAFLRGEAVSVIAETPRRRVTRWVAHSPSSALAILLTAILLGVVLVSGVAVWSLLEAAAADREALVATARLGAIERRANAIETEVLRFGRLLEGVSTATTIALSQTDPEATTIWYADDPSTAPALRDVAIDGTQASLDVPLFYDVESTPEGPRARDGRLTRLDATLRRAVLRSAPSGLATSQMEEAWSQFASGATPVRRIRVVLADGLELVFPGQIGAHTTDSRLSGWYLDSADKPFPHWDEPYLDAMGRVTVICARSIYADEGPSYLGVAAAEIALDKTVERLLVNDDPALTEQWLIDANGRVMGSSNGAGNLSPIALQGVAQGAKSRLVTWQDTEIDGNEAVVALAPLPALGWTLVGRFEDP